MSGRPALPANGLVVCRDPTLGKQIVDIAQAQRESLVQPSGMADSLRWEAVRSIEGVHRKTVASRRQLENALLAVPIAWAGEQPLVRQPRNESIRGKRRRPLREDCRAPAAPTARNLVSGPCGRWLPRSPTARRTTRILDHLSVRAVANCLPVEHVICNPECYHRQLLGVRRLAQRRSGHPLREITFTDQRVAAFVPIDRRAGTMPSMYGPAGRSRNQCRRRRNT